MIPSILRRQWPALIVIAIGLGSLLLVHESYRGWQRTLGSSVTSVDYVALSQLRLMRAYLEVERARAGDLSFDEASAAVQARSARDAMDEWIGGDEYLLGVSSLPPSNPRMVSMAADYREALRSFELQLVGGEVDLVEMRSRFSAAAAAGNALEFAVHDRLRERMAAERRRHLWRLGGWGMLLAFSTAGAAYVNHARQSADLSRERAERRLLHLRGIAPLGILECDAAGRIYAANDWWCVTTGAGEDAWRGRVWWDAVPHTERQNAARSWRTSVDSSRVGADDFHLCGRRPAAGPIDSAAEPCADDVTSTPVLARWAPSWSDAQDVLPETEPHWVVTFTDLTERRMMEEQLRESQKMEMMGQLAGAIAHDFNNLLTVIMSNAQMLRDAVVPDSEDAAVLDDIDHAAVSGAALVRDLMLSYRHSPMELRTVDLGSLINDNTRLIARLLPTSIEFSTHIEPDAPRVRVDPGSIQQILLNLAANARDAMPEGGRLTIRGGNVEIAPGGDVPPGVYGVLAVTDTGTGMSADTLRRIFEPFFTTKPPGYGTGLGLPTVSRLIQQHGGFLAVDTSIGHGSTFRLLLPPEEA